MSNRRAKSEERRKMSEEEREERRKEREEERGERRKEREERRKENKKEGGAGVPGSLESRIYKQTRCPRSHIFVPDPLMDLPLLEEVKIFLELDKTNELSFITDKWDCDNYSGLLRAKAMQYSHSKGKNWAFGECESNKLGGHRFNIVAAHPSAEVYYIEPQTDEFFKEPGKFKFILF